MSRWLRGVVPASILMTWLGAGLADAQARVAVTVRQLFDLGHRIEVSAGGGSSWPILISTAWFPAGAENPTGERVPGGSRAVFAKGGTYRGSFTVAAGTGRTTSTT